MTLQDTLALLPGFAGLALSVFLLWRTELRQADMSLRLLSPPDRWTVTMARRLASVQATDPAAADLLLMHGTFPVSAINDGPRGGALWDLAAEKEGLDAWRLRWFDSGKQLPYALPGRSCEGWTSTSMSLVCDFEKLGEGLQQLQQAGAVRFRIHYRCQGWRGSVSQKSTSLQMSGANLLAGFKNGSRFIDLQTCQVVPRCRELAVEYFAPFNLPDYESDILIRWALLRDPVEYVAVPDGSPARLKICIRRSNGQIDQGMAVGTGRNEEEVLRIIEAQQQLVGEVQKLRAAAVQLADLDAAESAASES